jgi:hypothetical protein
VEKVERRCLTGLWVLEVVKHGLTVDGNREGGAFGVVGSGAGVLLKEGVDPGEAGKQCGSLRAFGRVGRVWCCGGKDAAALGVSGYFVIG